MTTLFVLDFRPSSVSQRTLIASLAECGEQVCPEIREGGTASGPMARDGLNMSGSDSESEALLVSIPDGSVRLSSTFSGPTAHLLWRPNSHKFDDRIVPLTEPVKVGRSVAKLKPAAHNAIFDCKVLSRNHAMLWYQDGKFLIQDTQSSNGTFVNNDRLSKGTEEVPPREIFSGDVLQFGVDVIENSKKVTHGCVIALARLFHPDGVEAKPAASAVGYAFSSLTCSQCQCLAQSVMEANVREVILREKIGTLHFILGEVTRAAEESWDSMLNEERLLSKIASLEAKLASVSESNQTAEINKVLQAKETYEGLAKESLSTILQEKLVTLRKCDELQYLQKITNEQVGHLQKSNEALKGQLSELAEKCDTMKQETESILEGHVREKKELEAIIAQERDEVTKLTDNIGALQSELTAYKQPEAKVESPVSEKGLTIEDAASEAEDKISLDSFQGETKNIKDQILRLEEHLQQLKAKLSQAEADKAELQTELLIETNRADLASKMQVQLDVFKHDNAQLESKLERCREQLKQLAEFMQENAELKRQLRLGSAVHDLSAQSTEQQTTAAAVGASAASAEATQEIRNLQIELSTLKQSYARCIEEKVEMRKEFDEMAKEYGGVARQLNTVCRSAMVPLVVVCVAMVVVAQPFYRIFGSSNP
ncbi:sarcolemmal membrane-associated protein-like [Tropilaelaps mercedesae]|uniref:Sarcolemmal membrane-associated protein-like n=1 Tax=Tropilaelaps mercedesae TaxID=418985 RepID=A0A1V9Y211_9ACAR|nr:sarcolemmal membrane-associated protein-like [Tropilaelaps mercedesae]